MASKLEELAKVIRIDNIKGNTYQNDENNIVEHIKTL